MSWNGTVRCSHCYGKGHNKRSCPKRLKEAKENPDGYYGRQVAGERRDNKHRAMNRLCSYCRKTGHNRKTCKALKVDKVYAIKKNKKLVEIAKQAMKKCGLGIGALISTSKGDKVYLVTGMDWSIMDVKCFVNWTYDTPIVVRDFSDTYEQSLPLKYLPSFLHCFSELLEPHEEEFGKVNNPYYSQKDGNFRIISSPISAENVEKQMPDKWLSGEMLREKTWKDHQGKPERRVWVDRTFVDPSHEI